MRLSSLIASHDGTALHGTDVDITGLASDSREVKPGDLFIAVPGTQQDGRQYIQDAIRSGAVAVLLEEGTLTDLPVAVVTTPHVRKTASRIAALFFPQQPHVIAAITGTSGKTSTAQFVREMWQVLGFKSGSLGTLGLITADENHYGALTTPDPITLHRTLDATARNGITHLAIEASSHGLALHRLDHVRVRAAGFTNLSRDHLDFHHTTEEYLLAKLRLFTEVLPSGGVAVLNADIPEFERLAHQASARHLRIIAYGKKASHIRLLETTPDAKGQVLQIECFGHPFKILLPVMGEFQAWNGLCALGLVLASDADEAAAVAALGRVSGVPGRLQLAGTTRDGGAVFIDYAHKPDALENVLRALRPHVALHPGAKLGVVFGCGGNRDKGKRVLMGQIAGRLADWVIVTDDNPRQEEPSSIRREILAGLSEGPAVVEIGDRAQAIEAGIAKMRPFDVLIVAGKGHETGQIVGDKVLPFDDADVVRKVLSL